MSAPSYGILKRLRGLPVEGVDVGAAVAILLKPPLRAPQVLLVKRAVNPSDPWSGDMAFPGGRRRPEDSDLRETVTRETREETGIDLGRYRFLGALEIAHSTAAPELGVLPFVILCDESPEITLNDELCSYLWAPIERLRRSRGKALVNQREVPSYHTGGEVVWGLTYRVLESLLRLMEETNPAS